MKLFQRHLFLVILLFAVGFQYGYGVENDGSRYAAESKLNKQGSGKKWIKLKVEDNAIYKLTYEKIQSLGVDPSKAKIFGYGGWLLEEDFRNHYVDDLPEVACWKSGSGDELNPGEYLLFYGRGTVKWTYNSSEKEYVHENNHYSTYGVYFLTDAIEGKRKKMEPAKSPASTNVTLTSFEDYLVHEKDEFSVSKTGRDLYGESFSGKNTQIFNFNIPGILQGNENGNSAFVGSSVRLSFVSDKDKNYTTDLVLSVNNSSDQFVDLINAKTTGLDATYLRGILTDKKVTWDGDKNANTKIKIYHPCDMRMAYLNYIRLNMMRELKYYNTAYTFFRSSENLTKDVQYNIQNCNSNLLVFDVTKNFHSKIVQTTFSSGVLSFSAHRDTIREFVLVDPVSPNFPVPKESGEVAQQNLHGLEQIDMAIISPKAYITEAERLAKRHRTSARQLNVVVVTPEQIYNEFSSGTPDATAYRRFMKMFFDRGVTNNTNLPKYLLLFGSGMFDNRFIDSSLKSLNKDNYLLTYQTKDSSLEIDISCPNEDYFGFLDEAEESKSIETRKLMLGIGRYPVQSFASAKSSVDKQLSYMDNKNFGIWKNSVVLLSDDSSTNPNDAFVIHMKQTDSIAKFIMRDMYPEYMVTKIYTDAFKSEMTGGKKTYDNTAKKKLNKSFSDGCLFFNYVGHGGGSGFSNNIFTTVDIPKMNFKNLPLWFTATCDLTWFDGSNTTAGEEIFLSKSGGIALITTTRVVYSSENVKLNYEFAKNLFSKVNGVRPALGDVLRMSKNNVPSNFNNNKFKYILVGDPAMVLNYPDYDIEIDQINNLPVSSGPFTFKALETVKVSGFIKDGPSIDTSFNGVLNANVFDGMQTLYTVTTNGNYPNGYSFADYPTRVASVSGKVINGEFEFTFPVMRDISDINSLGKMNLYAYDTTAGNEANGSFLNYYLKGMANDSLLKVEDGPEIVYMYLNDSTTFKPGGLVNETPYFVAKVTDKYGINISGAAAGHNIQIVIDNSPLLTYVLNSYYIPSDNEANTGTIAFSIPELTEGNHTLRFQVWNILNNVTIGTLNFEVKKGLQPTIFDLYAQINPARIETGTEFVFTHNRPETLLDIKISIFDLSGRLVQTLDDMGIPLTVEYRVPWDLKANNGNFVQPGVYIYSATIQTIDGTETTKSKKLIVLGK